MTVAALSILLDDSNMIRDGLPHFLNSFWHASFLDPNVEKPFLDSLDFEISLSSHERLLMKQRILDFEAGFSNLLASLLEEVPILDSSEDGVFEEKYTSYMVIDVALMKGRLILYQKKWRNPEITFSLGQNPGQIIGRLLSVLQSIKKGPHEIWSACINQEIHHFLAGNMTSAVLMANLVLTRSENPLETGKLFKPTAMGHTARASDAYISCSDAMIDKAYDLAQKNFKAIMDS